MKEEHRKNKHFSYNIYKFWINIFLCGNETLPVRQEGAARRLARAEGGGREATSTDLWQPANRRKVHCDKAEEFIA